MGSGKTVLVSGATSQLGVFLLPRLQAQGFQVRAISRRAPISPLQVADGVYWVHPDFVTRLVVNGDPARVAGADYLISCGPIDLAEKLIRSHPGLCGAVVFSTSSVLSKENSGDRSESRHMAEIAKQESRLKALCAVHHLALLLLRPTLIYGCGLDRNISVLAGLGKRFGFIPVAGQANGLRQPVHADDLAELAVRALTVDELPCLESQVCGGSTLTYRSMAGKVAAACERPIRLVTLPAWMLAGAVRAASLLDPWKHLNAEMVRRQNLDLVFDDSRLRESLAYDPRHFQPGPEDFAIPEKARRFQLPDA